MEHRIVKVQESLILWNKQSRLLSWITMDNVKIWMTLKVKSAFIEVPAWIPLVQTGLYINCKNSFHQFAYMFIHFLTYFSEVWKLLEDWIPIRTNWMNLQHIRQLETNLVIPLGWKWIILSIRKKLFLKIILMFQPEKVVLNSSIYIGEKENLRSLVKIGLTNYPMRWF